MTCGGMSPRGPVICSPCWVQAGSPECTLEGGIAEFMKNLQSKGWDWWSSPSILGWMSRNKGFEQKPPQLIAANVLVGEEVIAQKAFEWLWSLLGMGAAYNGLGVSFHFKKTSSGFSGGNLLTRVSGKMGTALVTTLAGNNLIRIKETNKDGWHTCALEVVSNLRVLWWKGRDY